MKLNIEQLTELVKVEAEKLKRFSTQDERSSLNYKGLNAQHRDYCIYGQMTGYCASSRAVKLIGKCAEKLYEQHNAKYLHTRTTLTEFNTPKEILEAKQCKVFTYFSPIEVFISYNQDGQGKKINNRILIDYLKGERESLDFV